MSGRHPFSELTRDFTPERRRRVDDMKRELVAEMPLHELRRARALTQRDMAKKLKVNQPAVSKLEQRADVYVSSLRSYIEAGGRQAQDRGGVSGRQRRHYQFLGRGRVVVVTCRPMASFESVSLSRPIRIAPGSDRRHVDDRLS